MSEEWTIVKKNRKFSRKSTLIKADQEDFKLSPTLSEKELQELLTFIENSIEIFSGTSYYQCYSHKLRDVFGRSEIGEIVMLGVGGFSKDYSSSDLQRLLYNNSFWQLTFGLQLCRLRGDNTFSNGSETSSYQAISYDPLLTSDFDQSLYNALQIHLLEKSPLMNTQLLQCREFFPIKNSRGKRCLFYMPHCPYRLYCSVLYSYWDCLDSLIIIGNSFQSYSLRRLSRGNDQDISDTVALLTPFFEEISLCSLKQPTKRENCNDAQTSQRLITEYDHILQSAFSDLSILYIRENVLEENLELQRILRSRKPSLDVMINANQQDIELL